MNWSLSCDHGLHLSGSDELNVTTQYHFPGKSENNNGCFVVTTVSYSKRMEIISPVMTQMSVVKVVLIRRCPNIERVFGHCYHYKKSTGNYVSGP